ncbi:MAG: proteasome subunit alpha [Nitrospirota bacterium]
MFEEPYRWTEAVGNRRAYVDAQFTQGSPVAALSYRDGVVLATFQRGIPKLYEVYDRIALGGLGHPADLESLRAAALDMAHVEGFNRSPSDVTAMRLVKYGLAPIAKRAYEELFRAPLLARVLLAQVGTSRAQDILVTLDYDGSFESVAGRAAVAPSAEAAQSMLARLDAAGPWDDAPLSRALPAALRAWAVGDLAQSADFAAPAPDDARLTEHLKTCCADRRIEVALLDRTVAGSSKYRPLSPGEVSQILVPWLGEAAR